MTFDERVKRVIAEQLWQIMQLGQTLEAVSAQLKTYVDKYGEPSPDSEKDEVGEHGSDA